MREPQLDLFDALHDMVLVVGIDGRIRHGNQRAVERLGYSLPELTARDIWNLHPPHDATLREAVMREIVEGRATTVTIPLVARSGEEIPVETKVARTSWDGQDAFIGVCRDTSAHRAAEQALRESEARFRTLAEAIQAGVFIANADGRAVYLNPEVARSLGYTRDQMMGMPFLDFVHADDRPAAATEAGRILAGEAATSRFRCRLMTRGGSALWGDITLSALHTERGPMVIGVGLDVTDYVRQQEAIAASEERFRQMAETVDECFWILDPRESRMLYVSPAYERMTGHPAADVLKRLDSRQAALHPDDRSRVLATFDRQREGTPTVVEYRVLRPDGSIRWICTRAFPLRDASGSVYRIIGAGQDVTERIGVQALYRTIAVESIQGLVTLQGGRIVFANPAFCDITGYELRELLGFREENIRHLIDPADQPRAETLYQGSMAPGGAGRSTIRMVRRDGAVRWVDVHAARIEHAGRTAVQVACVDITERHQAQDALRASEARYRALAESSPDSIYMCDREGVILFVNAVGAAQFRRPPQELVGRSQDELFPAHIAERHRRSIRHVFETGEPLHAEVPELLRASQRWIDTRLVPLKAEDGQVRCVIGVSRDVTDRRSAEEALRQSEEKFRAYYASSPLPTVTCEWDGEDLVVRDYNEAALRFTRGGMDQLRGKRLGIILAHRPDVLDAMNHAYRNETTVEITTPYTLLSTGEVRTVHFTLAFVPPNYIACIMDDMTDRHTAEAERAQLAERLLEVQETERRDISALLHDHMGQLLTLARLDLESVVPADAASRRHMRDSLRQIDETLASVRRIAASLHPSALDDLSVSEALHTLVDDFERGSHLPISFRHPKRMPAVGAAAKVCLYRVMQEALTNAARHAHASRITVTLAARGGMIELGIRDNGRGFNAASPGRREGIGIISMRERTRLLQGSLTIDSRPGGGCRVTARIPARSPGPKAGDTP